MTTVLKTRLWNNITITEEISTSTGKMTLRNEAGTLLATSDPVEWVIDDLATFTRNYNSLNRSRNKSDQEFTQFFYAEGVPIFNKDRADVLNDINLYDSPDEYNKNLTSIYGFGVPGVKNPTTGLNVNSRGGYSLFNVEGTEPQTNNLRSDDSNATNLRESPNSYFLSSGGTSAKSVPSSVSSLMRYPSAQFSDDSSDFIQITGHKYKSPGAEAGYKDLVAGDRLGTPTGQVILPMHPGLSETSSTSWGDDSLNTIQAVAASAAGGLIDAGAKAFGLEGGEAGLGVKNTVSRAAQDVRELANSKGAIPFVKAYFAGKAVGSNIATRATGQVLNPNLELLFNGPTLRTFNFNFTLTPRDEEESQTIKNMIRFFKKNMNPFVEESKLFLNTPNIFQIEYMFKGGEHPFLNKIKPCALTNFSVQYTPSGAYSTYGDGSMTAYNLQMSFGELAPIYQNEQDAAGGTGY